MVIKTHRWRLSGAIALVAVAVVSGCGGAIDYTASGSSVTLTAPTQSGNYEIWYASDRVAGTFARTSIVVE